MVQNIDTDISSFNGVLRAAVNEICQLLLIEGALRPFVAQIFVDGSQIIGHFIY